MLHVITQDKLGCFETFSYCMERKKIRQDTQDDEIKVNLVDADIEQSLTEEIVNPKEKWVIFGNTDIGCVVLGTYYNKVAGMKALDKLIQAHKKGCNEKMDIFFTMPKSNIEKDFKLILGIDDD